MTGDASQVAEWSAVERARRRAARARATLLPDRLAAKLDAGIALQRWLNRPDADADTGPLPAAFAALDLPLPATLHAIFHGAFGSPTVGGDLPNVERFARLFLAFYPTEGNADAAAAAWQSLADTVLPPHRETLQGYFWARMAPGARREVRTPGKVEPPPAACAPLIPWRLEALLYTGIIGAIGLMRGALLLFW